MHICYIEHINLTNILFRNNDLNNEILQILEYIKLKLNVEILQEKKKTRNMNIVLEFEPIVE